VLYPHPDSHSLLLLRQGVRQVSSSEEEALKIAAAFLRRAGQRASAKEVFQKLGDIASLMEVCVWGGGGEGRRR
jgi:hypothetical protein